MKNRRNTRRGRAKRWVWRGVWRTREQWPVMVGRMGPFWVVDSASRGVSYMPFLNRRDAIRTAEHLARRR